jgi:hypothetical protein
MQKSERTNVTPDIRMVRVMQLQKRRQVEHFREAAEVDDREFQGDPLFEGDWEVFVVKRDPESGKFVIETVHAEELAEIS